MKRHKPLKRGRRVKPVNCARKAQAFARNFGPEADALRSLPCVVASHGNGKHPCSGGPEPSHNPSRGAGGGRFDMTIKCQHHHAEFHALGCESFQAKHGVDLRAEADRLALGHERPLGLRGVADRWAMDRALIDAYELDALRGWVTRELARAVKRRSGEMIVCDGLGLTESALAALSNLARSAYATAGLGDGLPADDREALSHHIAGLLGGPFLEDPHGEHGLAWSLCEWATEGRWVS